MKYVIKIFRSTKLALWGIIHAWRVDQSFRMEVVGGGIVVLYGVGLWQLRPLSSTEILLLVIGYGLILVAELLNTAFETALGKLHPDHDEAIGKSKDIASAAVFCAFCLLTIIAGVLLCVRL